MVPALPGGPLVRSPNNYLGPRDTILGLVRPLPILISSVSFLLCSIYIV